MLPSLQPLSFSLLRPRCLVRLTQPTRNLCVSTTACQVPMPHASSPAAQVSVVRAVLQEKRLLLLLLRSFPPVGQRKIHPSKAAACPQVALTTFILKAFESEARGKSDQPTRNENPRQIQPFLPPARRWSSCFEGGVQSGVKEKKDAPRSLSTPCFNKIKI